MAAKNLSIQITHPTKGILLLVPCADHAHDACWIFEMDMPARKRAGKAPVTFTSKKKAVAYIRWLVDYNPEYAGAAIASVQ